MKIPKRGVWTKIDSKPYKGVVINIDGSKMATGVGSRLHADTDSWANNKISNYYGSQDTTTYKEKKE